MNVSRIISLLALLLITGGLSAQQFTFGLQTGINLSTITIPNRPSMDDRSYNPLLGGPMAAAFIRYEGESPWGISLEPGINVKGTNQEFNTDEKARFQLTYLNVPVLINYQLGSRFRILAGPEMSFMLKATADIGTGPGSANNFYDQGPELSAMAGVQYEFLKHLELGLRVSQGLTRISQLTWTNASGEAIDTSNEFNQYLQLLLRWNI